MSTMESLPPELVEKILANLTYKEQGRILTVSKRWNMIIEGLLPPRIVNITGQRKNKVLDEKANLLSVVTPYIPFLGETLFIFPIVPATYRLEKDIGSI